MGVDYSLQMGEKSSFEHCVNTGMKPAPVSAQLLSPIGFDTLLGQYSLAAAT